MSQIDWKKLQKIFEKALLIPNEQHQRYLDEACLNDPEMLKAVKKLLDAAAINSGVDADPESRLV